MTAIVNGSSRSVAHHWVPPTGGTVRGSVVVLPGRGEHGGVYERFGRRLAADGYAAHALAAPAVADLDGLALAVAEAASGGPRPVVLVGSDTGALAALALAVAQRVAVDGVIAVGVPATDPGHGVTITGWGAELDARTACPVHRARLTDDNRFTLGGLGDPVPPALVEAVESIVDGLTLPVLVLHGAVDSVAPPATARALAARLAHAEFAVVREGRHDVLNDASHRTVAAHVVQWLERLRLGPGIPAIIAVEPPTSPAEQR